MNAYIFHSVHEELFGRVANVLRGRGITSFSGFVWGQQQVRTLARHGLDHDLLVFTRDMLPACDDGKRADLAWLRTRERDLGISIQRMLAAERHLLARRSYDQIMRMVEVALRAVSEAYDRFKPDFVFSEDISCLHSFVHFAIARERGIRFWCIGSARLPYRLSVYSGVVQQTQRLDAIFREIQRRGLTAEERALASEYVTAFRNRPVRPSGMATRARKPSLELADLSVLRRAADRFFGDRNDPTAVSPVAAVQARIRRIARVAIADVRDLFERPVEGEKYVLYPIHFQPEASTLVQAPMYLDQVNLLEEMAKSLPVDLRLYVKEHVSNRGRRPFEFYQRIRAIPSVRLLGPDEDTWTLIRNASAIAVITGTVGWEGLLFDKPVVTFGDVFYNLLPHVYRAGRAPKDDWYSLFSEAVTAHVPDSEAVLQLVSAIQQASHPGFIGNPSSFPEVLEPDNVSNIANALLAEIASEQKSNR